MHLHQLCIVSLANRSMLSAVSSGTNEEEKKILRTCLQHRAISYLNKAAATSGIVEVSGLFSANEISIVPLCNVILS